jgi:hypothetical protein
MSRVTDYSQIGPLYPDIRVEGETTLVVWTFSMAPLKEGGYLDHRFRFPFHKGTPSTARAGSHIENTGAKRYVLNTLQAESP